MKKKYEHKQEAFKFVFKIFKKFIKKCIYFFI